MTLRRAAPVAVVLALAALEFSCGDTFRPVAIPIIPNPPNPAASHFVMVLNSNGPNNRGSNTRIDVSGDTNVGVAQVGLGPVHAGLLPNGTRLYVANSLEDTVSSYTPSGIAPVTTTALPAGSHPVFVHTTENGTVYVANSGTGTVAAISVSNNVVINGGIITVGSNPVVLAETPDATKLYAVNQGSDSVTSINILDKSVNASISTGASPVWAVARSDSARVYVLNSGSGTVSAINTSSDAIIGSASVGAGANFMFYDASRNRLYVTNPAANTLSVLDATVDPPDPAFLLATISLGTGPTNQCVSGFCPVSVAALPDGSRAYVASYQVSSSSCSAGQTCTLTSQVTVINASSFTISSVIPLGTVNVDTAIDPLTNQPNDTGCNPATSTNPARFRLSVAAAAGNTRVYVANCDAGSTSIIRTSDDTPVQGQLFQVDPTTPPTCELIMPAPLTIPAPISSFPASSTICEILPPPQNAQFFTVPPLQNPMFIVTGP